MLGLDILFLVSLSDQTEDGKAAFGQKTSFYVVSPNFFMPGVGRLTPALILPKG